MKLEIELLPIKSASNMRCALFVPKKAKVIPFFALKDPTKFLAQMQKLMNRTGFLFYSDRAADRAAEGEAVNLPSEIPR